MFSRIAKFRRNVDALSREEAQIHPVTLQFKDSEFEDLFILTHVSREMPVCLAYMGVGLLAYFGFFVLDFLILSGEELRAVVKLRAAICCMLALLLVSHFFEWVRRRVQFVQTVVLITAGMGIIGMTALIEEPARHLYYAGIILVIIYTTNFTILRFIYSFLSTVTLLIAYIIVAGYVAPVESWALMNNMFFLVATVVFSLWASYASEYYIRSDFAHHYYLLAEKEKSDELLVAAEAGNRAKSDFLAVMSHELRTPLNAIIGFAEVIQNKMFGPLGSERYESYIDDIASSGHHLLSIINSILDLTKAESGNLELRDDDIILSDAVKKSLNVFRGLAAEKDITLKFQPGDTELEVRADPRLMHQMLSNLISNAIKFTEPGGRVLVTIVDAGEQGAEISVIDNGIGISEEDLPRVVEPFVQTESSLARTNEGTGLGLPLVKRMIELHAGELSLVSKLGSGTTACLRLPVERVVGVHRVTAKEDLVVA